MEIELSAPFARPGPGTTRVIRPGLPAVLLLVLPLAACGGGPQGCAVQTVADLPLLPNLSITAVRATLAGQDIALLIDTGAEISTVSRNGADRFDLRPGADARYTQLSGIGGATFAPIVTVHDLGLGHGVAPSLELPVAVEFRAPVDGLPVVGLFGTDFLSNYDVDLDVPHGHFGLYHAQGCPDDMRPFDPPYLSVPFRDDEGHIVVDIRLNGRPATAILDTGASTSLIDAADAGRAGVTADLLAPDRVGAVSGIASRAMPSHRHRFDSLEVGDERLSNVRLAVADTTIGETLLGRDFLRFNRVWISYRRRMLYIQPTVQGPVPTPGTSGGRSGG